jgi:hypothetical protein
MDKQAAKRQVDAVLAEVFKETPHPTKAENESIGNPRLVRKDDKESGKVYFIQIQVVESASAVVKESMPDGMTPAQRYRWLADQAEKREAIAALKKSVK